MDGLSAADILAIPLDQPQRLFPGDVNEANRRHKRLVAKWHPDRNHGVGSDVLGHINVLFANAITRIESGTWVGASMVTLTGDDGKRFEFRYQKSVPFELGHLYIARHSVLYVLRKPYRDLARNALSLASGFRFRDDAQRREHERYLPKVERAFPLADGESGVLIRKDPTQIRLADIHAHFGNIEPRHVAWILSSLYNLNCYLKWAGLNHNDISPNTYFVSPGAHNGALLGGWWYAASTGTKPRAVPQRTHRVGRDFTTKAVDATLIRVTGQELLGPLLSSAPKPMRLWLCGLGTQYAYDEYQDWSDMLLQAFGPRRYAEMKIPDTL